MLFLNLPAHRSVSSPGCKSFLILLFAGLIFAQIHAQTNYYTIANGDYDDCLIWNPTCPGNPIDPGDSVFIDHKVTILGNLNIEGVLTIAPTGQVIGDKEIQIKTGGFLYNNGLIDITKELHIDGSFYNNGNANVLSVHNDGYVCNTDTIQLDPNEKWDHHGGIIECGGTILACEFRLHANGALPATIRFQNLCCTDGFPPVFDLNRPYVIDSSTTSICNNLLFPIELLSFEADQEGETVRLRWLTGSELNNAYFSVEASANGQQWEEKVRIAGAGTTNETQSYEVIDPHPLQGLSWYRLKQVDYNGDHSYSEAVSVLFTPDDLVLYPNPASATFFIHFEGDFQYKVMDMMARQMASGTATDDVQIDLSRYPRGTYFVSVFQGDRVSLQKLWVR